jgi:hypothetical protein
MVMDGNARGHDDRHAQNFFVARQESAEDANRLADAVAEETTTELFEVDGSLVWLDPRAGGGDQPVAVYKDILRNIITQHIVSVRLVNRGMRWECERFSFNFPPGKNASEEPNEQILIGLIDMLLSRVAKGPRKSHQLSEQQEGEIRARLKVGEPQSNIARAYDVDIDTVRQVGR